MNIEFNKFRGKCKSIVKADEALSFGFSRCGRAGPEYMISGCCSLPESQQILSFPIHECYQGRIYEFCQGYRRQCQHFFRRGVYSLFYRGSRERHLGCKVHHIGSRNVKELHEIIFQAGDSRDCGHHYSPLILIKSLTLGEWGGRG